MCRGWQKVVDPRGSGLELCGVARVLSCLGT